MRYHLEDAFIEMHMSFFLLNLDSTHRLDMYAYEIRILIEGLLV